MFGIQLTTMQKLEVAFVCVILGIAGVFIFMSTRPTFEKAVRTYPLPTRHHPMNDNAQRSAPVTATNPADPKKDESVLVFACADGILEIIGYPNDASRHVALVWKPEKRQPDLVYQYYIDPMAPVKLIKDPFRHALAYATYNTVFSTGLGLLKSAAMTDVQIPQEAAARKQMMDEIAIINTSMDGGSYHPELMDKVTKALAAYNAKPGDPEVDNAKADLARKVLEAVKVYKTHEMEDKDKSIDTYMNVMDKLLTADQKQKLIDAYKLSTQPATRPAAGRRGGAGAGGAGGAGGVGAGGVGGGAASRGGAGGGAASRGGAGGAGGAGGGAGGRGGAGTRGGAPAGGATAPAGG